MLGFNLSYRPTYIIHKHSPHQYLVTNQPTHHVPPNPNNIVVDLLQSWNLSDGITISIFLLDKAFELTASIWLLSLPILFISSLPLPISDLSNLLPREAPSSCNCAEKLYSTSEDQLVNGTTHDIVVEPHGVVLHCAMVQHHLRARGDRWTKWERWIRVWEFNWIGGCGYI